jgi:CheY-like chemotaxis protein
VLARREVELVLLDSMMPGMSGIDLLRQLRQRFLTRAAAHHHGHGAG